MSFTPTSIFPLPSVPDNVYTDLWADNSSTSGGSDTTAFKTRIDGRDGGSCIVCGMRMAGSLQHCHIIPEAEPYTWNFMKQLGYIPEHAKSVEHESRNGILMCPNHHWAFNHFRFYIRWKIDTDEFVIVNHSREESLESFHGNILQINTKTHRCPFPTAFMWHEARVRGFHPVYPDRPVALSNAARVTGGGSGGVGLQRSGTLKPRSRNSGEGSGTTGRDSDANEGDDTTGSGQSVAGASGYNDMAVRTWLPTPLTGEDLKHFLEASRKHSSWKDCMVENLSWEGTATENITKYRGEVGIF